LSQAFPLFFLDIDMDTSIENTKCVILAAGVSSRLRPLTNDLPKCLLEVNGKTLLQRILENVYAAGIYSVAIVVGYKAEMIREHLRMQFPQKRIRYILNPNYPTTNNAYSLLLARKFLENQEGKITNNLLLLDSDLMFSPELLSSFLSDGAIDKIAVRIQGEHDAEEIGVVINAAGNITHIEKNTKFSIGESVGIEHFSAQTTTALFQMLGQRVRFDIGRTEYYEASFQQIIDQGAMLTIFDIGEHPVMEIDTMEDLQRAQLLKLD
jgi:choline kinase